VRKPNNPTEIQNLLETPQGQIMKAKAMVQISEEYLILLATKSQNPDLQLPEKMMYQMAMHECTQMILKNEQIINLMTQSNGNEIS
jgi:hypothetical protein